MSSYDKVRDYCHEIGAEFHDRTPLLNGRVNSGHCIIKPADTFLLGWKDSDRVDLEQRGLSLVFDLDGISCLPNKEAGCYIRGSEKIKEVENIKIGIFVSKIGGIESGAVRYDGKQLSFPIMTIFG